MSMLKVSLGAKGEGIRIGEETGGVRGHFSTQVDSFSWMGCSFSSNKCSIYTSSYSH